MRHSARNVQHTRLEGNHKRRSLSRRPIVEGLEGRALLSAAHDLAVHKHVAVPVPVDKHVAVPVKKIGNKTKLSIVPYFYFPLVSDKFGAPLSDSNLVDPWGINFPQQPGIVPPPEVWIADQGKGVVTMYAITTDGTGIMTSPLTVMIPTHGSSTPTGPTGVVQDPTMSFSFNGGAPFTYIFDTLQGTIAGYPGPNGSSSAQLVVKDNNPSTTEYTDLAAGNHTDKKSGTSTTYHYLYAANDKADANDKANPGIDVYNTSFQRVNDQGVFKGKGNFFDKKLPAGFTPYGVHFLEGTVIVTYRGPNGVGGAVDKFSYDGELLRRFGGGSNGASGRFQSPWGAAVISMQNAANIAGFGPYAPDVLIGNYRSGEIDAYNFTSGKYDGTLGTYASHASAGSKLVPLVLPGLRTIHFGPGITLFGANPPKTQLALLFTEDPVIGEIASIYGEISPFGLAE
jgi:uncharacterized protein (TIGR03118 family)